MNAEKLLRTGVGVLAVLLGVQIALSVPRGRPHAALASWANNPQSLKEAKDSSNEIVVGRVTAVRQAEPLVTATPGEPGGADSIPIEVVTIQVDRRHKGGHGGQQTIEVFHTGLSKGKPPHQRGDSAPEAPPPGARRPQGRVDRSPASSRTVILAEDPPYEQGERYVLFLRSGPTVTVGGQSVQTQRVLSPQGRYRVSRDSTIEPVSSRPGFARDQRGKKLSAFEALLP